MIIAYHIVFTTYGTWLPNDPRGSFSKQIYNQKLAIVAPIKYGRQEDLPNKGDLRNFWTEASGQIKRKSYFIDENARQVIANSFSKTIKGYNLIVPACAIMNDHIHILVLSTKYKIGFIVNQLKSTATKNLNLKDTPWTEGYWKVFIYNRGNITICNKIHQFKSCFCRDASTALGLYSFKFELIPRLERRCGNG